ncbi:hypothetical protein E6H33_02620 [Candidatus Bathyarchaeota archaeon]|nr:MAG: hypothetical protein E6H33_02620 [Candidatus Bathyarchaeota archaeon]
MLPRKISSNGTHLLSLQVLFEHENGTCARPNPTPGDLQVAQMMTRKTGSLQHIEINVTNLETSKGFYDGFLTWIGYNRVMDEKDIAGWSNGDIQIFLVNCEPHYRSAEFHRKHVGLNHVAFRASSREDVDRFFSEFLSTRRITVLYGGPKAYPEYSLTYYSVYFEDPDRIKLEFMHA